MKIALVNIFNPKAGSGDGITEYTYQLYKRLSKKHSVDLVFGLEESKRLDILGRVYVETLFRSATQKLLAGKYDIIHITNPEIGYFAKYLKKARSKAKIIVTVHDFVRVVSAHNGGGGGLQTLYDHLVAQNVDDAICYADSVLFTSSNELKYAKENYSLHGHSLIFIGAKESFISRPPIVKSRKSRSFTIGYVGGLVKSRNIDFILKTAEILGPTYNFKIYGTGAELAGLKEYKNQKGLANVSFMGFAPEKELLKIYDGFDLFMSCSSVDVASLPIEDALARGLPVVVAKRNVYDDELRWRVYGEKSPSDAAKRIGWLKKNGYPKKRQTSIINYAKSISWEHVSKKTESVYLDLLKN